MNKEVLLKHHFWILLLVFATLALTVPIMIYAAVGTEIADEKKKIDDAEAELGKVKPKGDDYKRVLEKLREDLREKGHKDWEESWLEQESLFTWPAEMAREAGVAKLNFGDLLSNDIIDSYTRRFYEQPYTDAVKQVSPTKFNGEWKSVLRYVPEWGKPKQPTSEEVWLALEDFWVQTELLRTVGMANLASTRFDPPSRAFSVTGRDGKPFDPTRKEEIIDLKDEKGNPLRDLKGNPRKLNRLVSVTQKFRMSAGAEDHWVMELTAVARGEKTAVTGTLTNVSKAPRSIGVDSREWLRFWTDRVALDEWNKFRGKRSPYDIRVPIQTGEVPPGGKYEIKEFVVDSDLKGRSAGLFEASIEEEGRRPDTTKGEKFVRKLRSKVWDLEIVAGFKPGDAGRATTIFRGTLTNISGVKQQIGQDSRMSLLVWTRKQQWEAWQETRAAEQLTNVKVPVESEPVPAGGKIEIAEFPFVGDLTAGDSNIYGVEPLLNAVTVPVKRIDVVALGYRSNRFANMALRSNLSARPAFKDSAPKEGEGNTGGTPGNYPGMPSGGMSGTPGMPSMRPSGPGGPVGEGAGPGGTPSVGSSGVGQSRPTSTGLERARYTDVTARVRRMPVAMTLVVEQAAIQDVQTAFANSRLRFQETQLHWTRTRENVVGDAPEPGSEEGPRSPMPGTPGYNPYVAKTGMGGRFELPGGAAPSETAADTVLPPTLVELTIYGIASLYERYRPEETTTKK